MTTATEPQRTQSQTREQQEDGDFSRLMSKSTRLGELNKTLHAAIPKIEAVLPDFMKGHAERLIARALITFYKQGLDAVPDGDFRRMVVEAAEMGYAIDGRLCYVVKYKNIYQLQLDYKAMVAVAKRSRTLTDVQADVVCRNDTFQHGRSGGQNTLVHTFDLGSERGEVIGAYCRVWLPDGSWNYALMDRAELDAIQRRAPAQNGPWKTDPNEMRKKTVVRRALKMYQDDPGLMRMLEITEEPTDESNNEVQPQTMADLANRLMSAPIRPPQPPADEIPEPDLPPADILADAANGFAACETVDEVAKFEGELLAREITGDQEQEIMRLSDAAKQRLQAVKGKAK